MKENTDKLIPTIDLVENFNKNDLLYGLTRIRNLYLPLLEKKHGDDDLLHTVDRFNKAIGLEFLETLSDAKEAKKTLIERATNFETPQKKKYPEEKQEKIKEYINNLMDSKKHTPIRDDASLKKDTTSKKRLPEEQRILRACKAALGNKNFHIHFCIDDLKPENILQLTDNEKQDAKGYHAYTSAELRYIFKNWDTLKDKITFYENGQKVDAPWINDSTPWLEYQAEKEKTKNKLIEPTLLKTTEPVIPRVRLVNQFSGIWSNAQKDGESSPRTPSPQKNTRKSDFPPAETPIQKKPKYKQ